MAWESRAGKRYFYTAQRVGERIVKEYQGNGPQAELLALWQEHLHERQRWETIRRRALLSEFLSVEREVKRFLSALRDLARALIEAEGYHRPGRGRWRKRRLKVLDESEESGRSLLPVDRKARRTLMKRGFSPKATGEELRTAAEVIRAELLLSGGREVKDYMSGGLLSLLERCIGPGDKAAARILLADSESEIEALAGGLNASPALKLLASRVVATRLHLAWLERHYQEEIERYEFAVQAWKRECLDEVTRSLKSSRRVLVRPKPTLDIAALDRQMDRAQRRHTDALAALIDAQRLPLPTVQIAAPGGSIVNLAEKQINVTPCPDAFPDMA